jgi:hypothetical protein
MEKIPMHILNRMLSLIAAVLVLGSLLAGSAAASAQMASNPIDDPLFPIDPPEVCAPEVVATPGTVEALAFAPALAFAGNPPPPTSTEEVGRESWADPVTFSGKGDGVSPRYYKVEPGTYRFVATVKKGECKKFLIQVYRKPTVIQGAALEPQLLFERDIQSSATRDVTITQDLDLTGSRVDTTFWVVIKAGSNTSWTVEITKR